MGRVILINPKRDGLFWGKALATPYTLMRLGSLLPPDIPVEIWDENTDALDFSRLRPDDLVGFTSMTVNIDRVRSIAAHIRPRAGAIVVGGVHATLLPEEVQEWADSVVVGEAYEAFPRLVNDYFNGVLKPRYDENDWADLKAMPPLRHDLLDQVQEHKRYWSRHLEVTRGCPRNCSFCTAIRVSGRVMRLRPIDEIMDEIEYRDLRRFALTDDNFGLNFRINTTYVEQFFRELRKRKVTSWNAQAEMMVSKYPDLLRQAKEAHADKFFVGFESVNPDNRRELGGKSKGINEDAKRTIKAFHAAGMGIVGLFVLGFDSDTPQTFQDTWDFIKDSGLDGVSVTIMTPFPGTPLRKELIESGRLLDEPWSHYDVSHVTYQPAQMTIEELREAYDWLCRKIYGPRQITARGVASLRRHPVRIVHRKVMSAFGTEMMFRRAYSYRNWTYQPGNLRLAPA